MIQANRARFALALLLAAPTLARAATMIAEESVVPGELAVRVYAHTLKTHRGPLEVWTFVSDGLRAAKQKELSFTVKRAAREKPEDYPRDLLAFYRTVHALARAGRIVDVGGVTQTAPTAPGFLGRDDFHCVLYTPYQPLEGVPVPGPSLTALIVTCNESDSIQYGHTRVMARLGAAERFFPTTPWADRERAELIGPDGNAGTVLARMPRASVLKAFVRRERNGRVVLTIGKAAHEIIRKVLARTQANMTMALLVTIDPTADACLVWRPNQKGTEGISAPWGTGGRIAANFIALAPGVDKDAAGIIEDGIGLAMTTDTWKKVRSALERGEALSLPELGDGFDIAWAPSEEDAPSVAPPRTRSQPDD